MSEQPQYHSFSEIVKDESLHDTELVKLIGLRETLIKQGAELMQGGQQITPGMRTELSEITQRISSRRNRLLELLERSEGDETYFHMLIAEDDLRQKVESNPRDIEAAEAWQAAREAIMVYPATLSFTEET